MKVVLKQDVKGLGKKGELVNASDGYARNFLFPKNLAVEANAQNMSELKNREQAEKYRIATETAAAKANAEKMSGKTIKLTAKAGANGKLFGSVTSKELAEKQALFLLFILHKLNCVACFSEGIHKSRFAEKMGETYGKEYGIVTLKVFLCCLYHNLITLGDHDLVIFFNSGFFFLCDIIGNLSLVTDIFCQLLFVALAPKVKELVASLQGSCS